MQRWWLTGEATLEELLSDEMMGPVVASAGLSREQLRLNLSEIARRIGGDRQSRMGSRKEPRQIAVGF
jgi:hypothetical protein